MHHIHEGDAGEVLFQMPQIDIAEVSTAKNCDMFSRNKIAAEKIFAALQVGLPFTPAT